MAEKATSPRCMSEICGEEGEGRRKDAVKEPLVTVHSYNVWQDRGESPGRSHSLRSSLAPRIRPAMVSTPHPAVALEASRGTTTGTNVVMDFRAPLLGHWSISHYSAFHS